MRHCENWNVLEREVLDYWLDNKINPVDGHQLDTLLTSPGWCGLKHRDSSSECIVKSECICYTCPHNSLPMGQGFNGQGA